MDSDTVKHLELLQAVINRMATTSFLIKSWSVTLISAMLVLSADETDSGVAALAALPCFMFWLLDAFFLRQERLFRALYDAVRSGATGANPFSMDTSPYARAVSCWLRVGFSITLVLFHGMLLLLVALVVWYLRFVR